MNFHLFIHHGQFPVETQNELQSTLKSFLRSSQMRPYFDAIVRAKPSPAKQQCFDKIRDFAKAFGEFLSSPAGADFKEMCETIEKETPREGIFANMPDGLAYAAYLRFLMMWKFAPYVDKIEKEVVALGRELLAQEHQTAISQLDTNRLCGFEEYNHASWVEATQHGKVLSPTFMQWQGYLRYVQSVLAPFQVLPLHSENKKQALSFKEKMDGIIDRLDKANKLVFNLSNEYYQTEMKIKDKRILKGICVASYFRATGQHPRHDPICPKSFSDRLDKLQQDYHELFAQRSKLRKLIAEVSERYCLDGALDKDSPLYVECQPELHFWTENLPRYHKRLDDMQSLQDFTPSKAKDFDIVYRYISQGELDNLIQIKQFNQSPGHCLEREKWFFYKGGNPGNGVTHPVACTVYLKKGALDLLLKLQKPDGQYAAVVSKENETCCLGIHEDALPAFNQLIAKVEARKTNTKKLIKTIFFDTALEQEIQPEQAVEPKPPLLFMFEDITYRMNELNLEEKEEQEPPKPNASLEPHSRNHSAA